MEVLRELDPKKHRVSLCQYNDAENGVTFANQFYQKFVDQIRKEGFEAKFFSSFGADKNAGCGMLSNHFPKGANRAGPGFRAHYEEALQLLCDIEGKNQSLDLRSSPRLEC
jgi:hypothetical protein